MMIAVFPFGKTYHLMRASSDDEFFRAGITHCGRVIDEMYDDVEIVALALEPERSPVCKKCLTESMKRAEYPHGVVKA